MRAGAGSAGGGSGSDDEDLEGGGGGGAVSVDEVVRGLVTELVLCTKEANTKTRAVAYGLLVSLAHGVDAADPPRGGSGGGFDDDDAMGGGASGGAGGIAAGGGGGLHRLVTTVMAGLVSVTPHMQSASTMALARLLYEFAPRLEGLAPRLLPAVLLLLRTKSREVVKSVLGFVKVRVHAALHVALQQRGQTRKAGGNGSWGALQR
eukprot:364519-Chlamydomonas_euryale.AAC.1